jgi:hypothetical protein
MPVDDLARLRALLAVATPLPWKLSEEHVREWFSLYGKLPEDADLANCAVNALPGLLKRLERAEAALREVRAELAEVNALALDE